jgi:hypothetical protein
VGEFLLPVGNAAARECHMFKTHYSECKKGDKCTYKSNGIQDILIKSPCLST